MLRFLFLVLPAFAAPAAGLGVIGRLPQIRRDVLRETAARRTIPTRFTLLRTS